MAERRPGGEVGRVEIEWLHRNTVRELQLTTTAIRNAIYAGRPVEAMDLLRALRVRIGLYERSEEDGRG